MNNVTKTIDFNGKEVQFIRLNISDLETLSNKLLDERNKVASEVADTLNCTRQEKANILIQIKLAKMTIDEMYNNISIPAHCKAILDFSLNKSGIKDIKERLEIINSMNLTEGRKVSSLLIADEQESPIAEEKKETEEKNVQT